LNFQSIALSIMYSIVKDCLGSLGGGV
jgi:hypothetical protein